MPETATSLLPVVTFVGGFATKWISDWLQDKRLIRREREARQEARRDALAQRRSDFQRQNLLDLQDSCMRLIRAAAQINHNDAMAYRKTGTWGRSPVPDDVDRAFAEEQRATTTLAVRIRDAAIRSLTEELKSACSSIGGAKDEASSDQLLRTMSTVHMKLNERIGEVLRTLDDGDFQSASG